MCDGCRCQSVERYKDAICKIKVDSRRRLCTKPGQIRRFCVQKKNPSRHHSLFVQISLSSTPVICGKSNINMEGGGGGPPSFYLPPFHRLVNKSSVRKREREKRRVIIKPSRLPKRIQQILPVPQGQSFHTKGKDIGDFHTGVTDSPAVIRSLRSCCILSSFLPPITSLSLSSSSFLIWRIDSDMRS